MTKSIDFMSRQSFSATTQCLFLCEWKLGGFECLLTNGANIDEVDPNNCKLEEWLRSLSLALVPHNFHAVLNELKYACSSIKNKRKYAF
jgi:hypothetical protein